MHVAEYEVVYLAKPDFEDPVFDEIADRIETIIKDGSGTVFLRDHWGKKRLAYDIEKQSRAHYTLLVFASDPAAVTKLDKFLRFDERIMRHLVVHTRDRVDVEERIAWGRVRAEQLKTEREERARMEAEAAEGRPYDDGGDGFEAMDAEELAMNMDQVPVKRRSRRTEEGT